MLLTCGVVFGLSGCARDSSSRSATREVDAAAFINPDPAVPVPRASGGGTAQASAVQPLATPYDLPPDEYTPGGDTPVITLGGRPARVIARADELREVDTLTAAPGEESAAALASPGATPTTTTTAAPPTLSPTVPAPALDPLTLDATVGQINGEPVYADAFFKDNQLEERLVAESSRRKTQREWLVVANDAISKALVTRVRDELVLADAYADFPGEKRQGLRAFLTRVQADEISQRGGSAVIAEQELLETKGRTLDEEARDQLEQQLINYKVNQRVSARAVVTPRQVRREYERNFNEFNEPSTAHFRLIFMSAADAQGEKGAAVRDALAAGKPFEEVAAGEYNTFNRTQGGAISVEVRGPLTDAQQLFADERLTAAARTLTLGQTVGPVTWGEAGRGDRVAWIHLDAIDTGESISLYDAQLGIETRIRDRRINEERERYFLELLERGSYSDIDLMRARLLEIAVERYWRPTDE